jgi:hypothetical protein
VVVPLLSVFAAAINTELFLHSENRLLVSLMSLVAFLALYRRSWGAIAVAFLLAVPMLQSYEGALFDGPVLAGICWWRMRQERGRKRIAWAGLVAWMVAITLIAVRYIIWPNDPSNFITFSAGTFAIVDENFFPHIGMVASLMVLIALTVKQLRPAWIQKFRSRGIALFCLIGGWLIIQPLYWPQALAPETHQQMRSMNVFVPVALLLVLWGHEAGRWCIRPGVWRMGIVLVAILGVAQSGWNLQATAQWNRYVEIFRSELVRLPAGPVRFQDTRLAERSARDGISAGMHCDWAAGHMSILLAPNPAVRTIVLHSYDNLFKPFDPRIAEELPDLSQFGYDYQPYLKALKQQPRVEVPERELPDWLKWLDAEFNRQFRSED